MGNSTVTLPPPSEKLVTPPPSTTIGEFKSTTTESSARQRLVEKYRNLMDVATVILFVSLLSVCFSWFMVLQTGKLGGKPVFCMLLGFIAFAVLSSLYLLGRACFVYLLATGREDMAWEWSTNVIVEFIFGTHKANALFNNYRQLPSHSSNSGAKNELADEYRYMFNDATFLLIGSFLLLFLPAFPLLSRMRSGLVLVASFIAAAALTVFCLFLTIGRYVFKHLLSVGREDIVREWSQKTFLFSTDRASAIFQRISIQQQQEKAMHYHQV